MVLNYIRKGALCTLLGLGALVSPAIIPCNISSVYAQEQKENPQKQESRGLQELLSEEVKRLEEKEKMPADFVRMIELYLDKKEIFNDAAIKPEDLLAKIKGKEGPEFEYLDLFLSGKAGGKIKDQAFYENLIKKNVSQDILSRFYVLYASYFYAHSDFDECSSKLKKAIETDPNNFSAYARMFYVSFEKILFNYDKLLGEEKTKKITELVNDQELLLKNALAAISGLTPLDSILVKYKLCTEYSQFLRAAARGLFGNDISDKKVLKDLAKIRRDYVFEYAKLKQIALAMFPNVPDYASFCRVDTANLGHFFLADEQYLSEKKDRLTLMDIILKVHDEGLKCYPTAGEIYYYKADALCAKAVIDSGSDNWGRDRLSSSAKALCRDAIKCYESAIKYGDESIGRSATAKIASIKRKIGIK